jgi:hypothetical protein
MTYSIIVALLGIFHNLVFTFVDFRNNIPYAKTSAYAFSQDIYYSWTMAKDKPELIVDNIQKAYEAMKEGSFLVRKGDESNLPKPLPSYPIIVPIKINLKEGFKIQANHNFDTHDGSSLYYYMLPKYCYCTEHGIKSNNDNKPIILTWEERQTIAFIHSKDEFQLELPFICTNQSEFNKLREQHPRTIIIPSWLKATYIEFKDFAAKVVADSLKGQT